MNNPSLLLQENIINTQNQLSNLKKEIRSLTNTFNTLINKSANSVNSLLTNLKALYEELTKISNLENTFVCFSELSNYKNNISDIDTHISSIFDVITEISKCEDVFAGFSKATDVQNNLEQIYETLININKEYNKPGLMDFIDATSSALSILSTDWKKVKDTIELVQIAVYVFFDNLAKKAGGKIKEITNPLKDLASKLKNTLNGFFKNNWQIIMLISAFAVLATGIGLLIANWGKMSSFEKAVTIFSAIAAAAAAAAIAVALFHTSWTVGVAAAAIAAGAALIIGTLASTKNTSIPTASLSAPNIPEAPDLYATGGFPSMGQMFIAREAGPELVGTIGSRNAVVNNDQIVESVSAGVYKAVREAMNGGQANGQKAVITLDKRVLGEFTIGYINGKTKETGLSPILV